MKKEDIVFFICDWVHKKTHEKIEESEDMFIVGKLDSLLFAELIAEIEVQYKTIIDFSEIEDWEQSKTPLGLSRMILT